MCRPDWTRLVCGRGLHQHATNLHELLIRCEYSSHPASLEYYMRSPTEALLSWLMTLTPRFDDAAASWQGCKVKRAAAGGGCRGAKYAQTQTHTTWMSALLLLECKDKFHLDIRAAELVFLLSCSHRNEPARCQEQHQPVKVDFIWTPLHFASVRAVNIKHTCMLTFPPFLKDVQGSTRRSPH